MVEVDDKKMEKKPLFRDINADDDDPEITEMESLCMQCEENGTTRLLLTKIPFFKEVILMSFECSHCGHKDNEIKPGSMIQDKGVRYKLQVKDKQMMNRQIVRQTSAMYRIEEIDFEAPAFQTKGVLTTLEGLLQNAIDGLQDQQPVRKIMHPDIASKIDDITGKLEEFKSGEHPFTFILEDPSGNSFVENPCVPDNDPFLSIEMFTRTKEQNESIGIFESEPLAEAEQESGKSDLKDEVIEFVANCPSCQSPAMTKMKLLAIPHFKEMIVMATTCDSCGYKSNEIKAGGGIEPKGKKIIFKMTDKTDLSRDVLASETCSVSIPELDLELRHSSMGGKFTTLEGLVINMKDELGKVNPFIMGDSASKENKMKSIIDKLNQIANGELFVTLILDDPVGNSFLQNLYAPDPDPELSIEEYERTKDQDDELGISDMRADDYR